MCLKLDSNKNILKINSDRNENNVIYDYFKIDNQKKTLNDEKIINNAKQKSIINKSRNSITNGLKNNVLLNSSKDINKNINNNHHIAIKNEIKNLESPTNNDDGITFKNKNKDKIIFYDTLEQCIN